MEYPNQVPEKPMVSVCIQTYNHEKYIAQCIEGVLMQEADFTIEILIGEDESTDRTREICLEYAERHPDMIRLFLRRKEDKIWINGNLTGRFNYLANMAAAHGKYIAFCDGDDSWSDPQKLSKQFRLLEANPSWSIVAGNTHIIDRESQVTRTIDRPARTFTFEDLVASNILGHSSSTVFFRRASLPATFQDDLQSPPFGDWPVSLLLLKSGPGYYMEDVLANYRVHGAGWWSSKSSEERLIVLLDLYDFMLDTFPEDRKLIRSARNELVTRELNKPQRPVGLKRLLKERLRMKIRGFLSPLVKVMGMVNSRQS